MKQSKKETSKKTMDSSVYDMDSYEEMLDSKEIRQLLSSFHSFFQLAVAVMDSKTHKPYSNLETNICTNYFRNYSKSFEVCLEWEKDRNSRLFGDEDSLCFKCKQGMRSLIRKIYVDGVNVGSIYIGQFFFPADIPENSLIEEIAEKYDLPFDDFAYDIGQVPIYTEPEINKIADFAKDIVEMTATKVLNNIKLTKEMFLRQESEAALEKSDYLYKLLAENISDVIWVFDLELNLIYISPSTEKLLGWSLEERQQLHLSELVSPQTTRKIMNIVRDSLNLASENLESVRGYEVVDEVEIRMKNGKTKWIEVKASFVFEGDNIIGIEGISRDIDERKQTEFALAEYNRNANILHDASLEFVDFKGDDVYSFIAEKVRQVAGSSIVIVNSIDKKKMILDCRAITGDKDVLELVNKTLDIPITVLSFPIDNSVIEPLYSGTLFEIPDVRSFTFNMLPDSVYEKLALIFKIKKIFSIGLTSADGVVGNVAIIQFDDNKVNIYENLIEIFIKQASIFLQKRIAENALRESEEFFRNITSNMMDMITIVGLDGKVIYASPANTSVIGYTVNEMIGMEVLQLLRSDEMDLYNEKFFEMFEHTDSGKFEFHIKKKNGEYIWIESNIRMIKDADGKNKEILFASRDISDRKKIEAEINENSRQIESQLKEMQILNRKLGNRNAKISQLNEELVESENRFKQLFNEMSNGFAVQEIIVDEAGKPIDLIYREINPAFEKLTGLKKEDVLNKRLTEILPKVEPFWLEYYGKVALTGEEIKILDYGAAFNKYWEVTAYSPKPMFCAAIFSDITDKKIAEDALRESEQNYRTLFNTMNQGVVYHDANRVVVSLNPAGAEILGLNANEVVGKDILTLNLPFRDEYGKPCPVENLPSTIAIRTGKMVENHVLTIFNHKKNKDVVVKVSAIPIYNQLNETLKLTYLIFEDITESVASRLALKQSEQYMKALLNNTRQAFILINPDGQILAFNKLVEIFAIDYINKEIHQGVYIKEYLPVQYYKMFLVNFNKALEGQRITSERDIFFGDTLFWLSLDYEPVVENDIIVAVSVVLTDITERINAIDQLRKSEEQYRSLINASPDAITVTSNDGSIVFVSPKTPEVYGVKSPNDILGANILNWVYPEDREKALPIFCQTEKDVFTGSEKHTLRLFKGDGSVFYGEITAHPIYGHDGRKSSTVSVTRDITLRIQTEKALQESEERFRTYIVASPTAVFIIGVRMNITFVNPSASVLLGYAESELIKMSIDDVVPKQYVNFALHNFTKLAERGTGNYEQILMKSDGTEISVLLSVVRLSDESFMAYCIDISDRKKFETALKENDERFRYFMKYNPNALAIMDKELQFIFVSDKYLYDFNIHGKSIIGQSINIVQPRFAADMKTIHAEALSGNVIRNENYILVRDDGTYDHCRWEYRPWYDAIGKIGGIIVYIEVITERVKAELALMESEDKYRKMTENISDGVYAANNGVFFYVNRQMTDIFEYPEEELLGKEIWSLITPEFADTMRDDFERRMANHDYSPIVTECMSKTGKTFYAEISINFSTIDRTVYGLIRDVTERKMYEDELMSAKLKAEESDRLKSAFLANMSHEIRTPMNGIIGFSELLKTPDLEVGERDEYIEVIDRCSKQLLSIINDIIDISKIEIGQITLQESAIYLNTLIQELHTFFKPNAENKDLELKTVCAYSDEESVFIADEVKLRQILNNLLVNALKFTSMGYVEFGYRLNPAKHGYVEFFVKDTGIGIQSDYKDVIFERFRQVEPHLTRVYGGTGLGLAISKAYVECMGGEITLESEFELGSEFIFTLPIKMQISDTNSYKKNFADEWNLSGRSLLVVEDEDDNYKLLEILLSGSDATITRASSGLEAVETFKEMAPFDLILMDIKLPEMDGLEATRRIREIDQFVPIIAQTAYALSDDRDKAINAGCNDYLDKPLTKKRLIEKIKKYL